jgi:hypothetical protein
MSNKKQTAVQRLVEQLRFTHKEAYNDLYEVIQQELEMEKQQIIEAFNLGQQKEAKQEFWTKGEQYYKETYED